LSGIISKKWGLAQQLYQQEVIDDYPKTIPRTWADTVLAE